MVVFWQCVEPGVPVAQVMFHSRGAVALPGLVAGASSWTARVLDALVTGGTGPAGVTETLVRDAILVGAEPVFHAAVCFGIINSKVFGVRQ